MPAPPANLFEVRAVVYGGIIGPLVDAHPTLEDAEAAHAQDDAGVVLIVLGPGPDEKDRKAVCSERDSSGRWKRTDLPWPSAKG